MTQAQAEQIWRRYWQTVAWEDDFFLAQMGIAPLDRLPRAIGTAHLPPIPDKHRRILASNGAVWDIPEENIRKAFAIDPQLHVLRR